MPPRQEPGGLEEQPLRGQRRLEEGPCDCWVVFPPDNNIDYNYCSPCDCSVVSLVISSRLSTLPSLLLLHQAMVGDRIPRIEVSDV